MTWLAALDAAGFLLALAVVFVPLERAWRAHSQPVVRSELGTDVLFYASQYLWFGPWAALALQGVRQWVSPLAIASLDTAMPWWFRALLAVVCGDLLVYWGHRAQHRVPWLWRFHRVHHTPREVDWLAAHREHPVDGLYTRLLQNQPAMLLGFSFAGIAGLVIFRSMWGLVLHSNVDFRLGRLGLLVGSPHLHRWHHHPVHGQRANFANLCPLWDVVFGTHLDPAEAPDRFGVDEPLRRGFWAYLIRPLWSSWHRRPPMSLDLAATPSDLERPCPSAVGSGGGDGWGHG